MDSTTERRGPDGLTRSDRATLRDPATLEVMQCNPCRYLVSSKTCFADFDLVLIGYGRFVRITSNTGSVIDVNIGEPCPCEHSRRNGGACKHMTVLGAVLEHRAAQGECPRQA